jgi:hypothetical protein
MHTPDKEQTGLAVFFFQTGFRGPRGIYILGCVDISS